jgi:hypothetical protein
MEKNIYKGWGDDENDINFKICFFLFNFELDHINYWYFIIFSHLRSSKLLFLEIKFKLNAYKNK